MSRGLGRLERRIIELLTPKVKGHVPRWGARDLALAVHGWGQPVSAGARASVYQALSSLERKGIITRIQEHRRREWFLAEAQRQEADRQREEEAQGGAAREGAPAAAEPCQEQRVSDPTQAAPATHRPPGALARHAGQCP
jgi:hypothetical protein